MIKIKNLGKEYKKNSKKLLAVDNISLKIKKREFVSIIGPSGCGKTTILKLVGGLLEPTEGSIAFSNKKCAFSFVFQNPVSLPWRNIQQNVSLPIEIKRKKIKIRSVNKMIDLVGLNGFGTSYPNELSGGMQQRVAIARALISDPRLLLMDEPFGALDEINRNNMNFELLRIWKQLGLTVLFVTHSITEAVFLSDRIVVLSKRPARIKGILNINFSRPRDLSLKESLEFQKHVRWIRKKLE